MHSFIRIHNADHICDVDVEIVPMGFTEDNHLRVLGVKLFGGIHLFESVGVPLYKVDVSIHGEIFGIFKRDVTWWIISRMSVKGDAGEIMEFSIVGGRFGQSLRCWRGDLESYHDWVNGVQFSLKVFIQLHSRRNIAQHLYGYV